MSKSLAVLAILALCAAPALAGGLAITASYWDPDDVDDDVGLGFKLEFAADARWDVEFRGAYFEELESEPGGAFSLEAVPLDAGIAINFNRYGNANPFLGVGGSYYLLDTDRGLIDDEFGWYAVAGLEVGVHERWAILFEALYRDVQAEVEGNDLGDITSIPLDLGGGAANLGLMLRW